MIDKKNKKTWSVCEVPSLTMAPFTHHRLLNSWRRYTVWISPSVQYVISKNQESNALRSSPVLLLESVTHLAPTRRVKWVLGLWVSQTAQGDVWRWCSENNAVGRQHEQRDGFQMRFLCYQRVWTVFHLSAGSFFFTQESSWALLTLMHLHLVRGWLVFSAGKTFAKI